MNKILVEVYVPTIEKKYDVLLPINKKIHQIISLMVKAINELCGGYYTPSTMPILYDKLTAKPYDVNLSLASSDIRNGTELILM